MQKNISKIVINLWLIIFMQYDIILSAAFSTSRSSVPKKYTEVFDPLVCAVLDGNIIKVSSALAKIEKERVYDCHQRISYNFTLRHIAWNPGIDSLLKLFGVAPLGERLVTTISAELACDYGNNIEIIKAMASRYRLNSGALRHLKDEIIISKMRDPVARDIYGKYTEDYSFKQRAELARQMRESYYQ